ncbi:3'-5' exonuclease [Streptomyces californicus]
MLQPGVACVLDVETTGLGPADRVIEVAAVDAYDGSVLIDTLVHPGANITIPAGATRVHGITNSMVADARPWSTVLPEVLAAVGGRTLLAYNSSFDRRMAVGHARSLGLDPGRLQSWQSWQCLMKRPFHVVGHYHPPPALRSAPCPRGRGRGPGPSPVLAGAAAAHPSCDAVLTGNRRGEPSGHNDVRRGRTGEGRCTCT